MCQCLVCWDAGLVICIGDACSNSALAVVYTAWQYRHWTKKKSLTSTNIWLWSSVGQGATGIHSGVKCSYRYLSATAQIGSGENKHVYTGVIFLIQLVAQLYQPFYKFMWTLLERKCHHSILTERCLRHAYVHHFFSAMQWLTLKFQIWPCK